ncbi:MAG: hypothetical protein CPDRYMAC_7014 [uncultured Paraburkholderia sp.]|nr:MAG: hypothetical protein CPDRYMAC_7014 [uncultured Paraburkholderia sp.]
MLVLIKNPPEPNEKLLATAQAMPTGMTHPAWHEEAIGKQHERDAFNCAEGELNDYLKKIRSAKSREWRSQDVSGD